MGKSGLWKFVGILGLLGVLLVGCAVDGLEEAQEAQEVSQITAALGGAGDPCRNPCNCKLGLFCSSASGTCQPYLFGPPPPAPCYASCQCPARQSCVFSGNPFGSCESPPRNCASDCDCGVAFVCHIDPGDTEGRCTSDFSPFPQCRCDKHCPSGRHCVGGICS